MCGGGRAGGGIVGDEKQAGATLYLLGRTCQDNNRGLEQAEAQHITVKLQGTRGVGVGVGSGGASQ